MDSEFSAVYNDFEKECHNNSEFFKSDNSEKGKYLHSILIDWQENVTKCKNSVININKFMASYDFDENTPGNGYRSFVRITEACTAEGLKLCRALSKSRESIFFRKGYYIKEIESYNALQASLKTCLDYLFVLKEWSEEGDLFAKHNVELLFEQGDIINQYSFYGRCLGFQYRKALRNVLRFISTAMAGFSESYYSNSNPITKLTNSLWTGGKYFFNQELRAERIVAISQNAGVDFCKSFWFLAESELMNTLPAIVGCVVKVNTTIDIPAESLLIESKTQDEELIDIPIPTIYLGHRPITVRLLSTHKYETSSSIESKNKNKGLSEKLLFHCHGGGFVAQSSKSHELYLRDWAMHIKTPILSVDYSLAPDAPFPRALDEVFYAYCWALKNAESIGWSGKYIVVAGDSAGANLVLGVTLKCIQLGIQKPDGIFLSYCPTLINFSPSPARLLCLMDPILPFGFLMRCLRAYAHPNSRNLLCNKTKLVLNESTAATTSQNTEDEADTEFDICQKMPVIRKEFKKMDTLIRNSNESFVFEVPENPFLSPYSADEQDLAQYPKIKILTADMDPCLDDCVMLAKKLKRLNVDVSLDILQGLPHGFLNFTMVSSEAMEGSKACASHIADLFQCCDKENL